MKTEEQRKKHNESNRRWRARNLEKARKITRESERQYRAKNLRKIREKNRVWMRQHEFRKKFKKEESKKHQEFLKKNREKQSEWRRKLKEEGKYEAYLAYRREWIWRKRHGYPTTPKSEFGQRYGYVATSRRYKSTETGNEKWKELDEAEKEWQRRHKK